MEDRITPVEEVARQVIESNFDNVLRTTPLAIEEFESEYPRACEIVNRKAREQGVEDLGNVFRPGVPDFLGFDDDGTYKFIEVKGEGDGLRHSQLKWFRDFGELNAEIWFADSNDGITEKMDSDRLESYSLRKPDSVNNGEAEVKDGEQGFLTVQIPETLAAVMGLEEGDRVDWSIVDRSNLRLDTD
jgi:hypothetical protein